MRQMMQTVLVCGRGQLITAVSNLRVKHDRTDPRHTLLVLGHHANCRIKVTIHAKPLLAGQKQKSKHVAARNRGNESLLRVNVRRI
jgi:hypothetical protein